MNEIEPSMQCHSEGRKQYQWQILPPPMVSSNMRSNLLIIGYFVRNFFLLSYLFTSSLLIIICGKYSIVERFMRQILISVAGHASVLISKWRYVLYGHCFMWSQGSTSQMTAYLKPRRKGNLGGVEELKQGKVPERKVLLRTPKPRHINSINPKNGWWKWGIWAWYVKISSGKQIPQIMVLP